MFRGLIVTCFCACSFCVAQAENPWSLGELPTAPPAGPPRSQLELQQAKAYLQTFGASADAPRVTFDILMAAAVAGDAATADEMRRRLILEYPESIQHRYYLSTTDAKTYRELLTKIGNENDFTLDFAAKFVHAVEFGIRAWGNQFLTDDNFLLQCGLAAQITQNSKPVEVGLDIGKALAEERDPADPNFSLLDSLGKPSNSNTQLIEYCLAKLTEKRNNENQHRQKIRAVAEVLFDDTLSPADKSLKLHAIEDNQIASRLADHFDARLPEDERSRADLTEARIERMLEDRAFEEALSAIDPLISTHGETAKRLFWRGLSRLITGDQNALADFRQVTEAFPTDPWAAQSKSAALIARELDQRLDEQSAVLAAIVRKAVNDKIDQIEVDGEWRHTNGVSTTVYGRASFDDKTLEATLRRGDVWYAALRSDLDKTSLLLHGDDRRHDFTGAMPINLPKPSVKYDPVERRFGFAVGDDAAAKYTDGGATNEATMALLKSMPPEVARPILNGQIEQGRLPLAMIERDNQRIFEWIEFHYRRPEQRTWTVRISPDDRLASAAGPNFVLRSLKYGRTDSFVATPPQWPDLPVTEHAEFDPALMFQAMAAVTRLWNEEEIGPGRVASTTGDATPAR